MRLADWASDSLPTDSGRAKLVGRVWDPAVGGPSVVALRGAEIVELSAEAPTMRDLCEADDAARLARSAKGRPLGPLADVLKNTPRQGRDAARPWLLAPI